MQQLKITPSVTIRTQTVTQYLADICHYERITPEEETELATRIRAGDEEAFKRMVEANLRFVVSVAKQCPGRQPAGYRRRAAGPVGPGGSLRGDSHPQR